MQFEAVSPSLENYWRAIILFGQNVASYKFALAKSLFDFAQTGKTIVTLEDLAEPYSKYLTEHLKIASKQTTSPSSRFLDACRRFNSGELSKDELVGTTVKLGFNNVIDAFHTVNKAETPIRFYIDERNTRTKGIKLTDNLLKLLEEYQYQNLPYEVEARWTLVETAWELNISRNLIVVSYDEQGGLFFTENYLNRRKDVTSCRDALNGYQKGKCFYCFCNISIAEGKKDLAHVDHFFPHTLKRFNVIPTIDGVWNLVLACQKCNSSKSARVPHDRYLSRLNTRNEFLVRSHHPLRETLIRQTADSKENRAKFLRRNDKKAIEILLHRWQAEDEQEPIF